MQLEEVHQGVQDASWSGDGAAGVHLLSAGILTVSAPRQIQAPEGAEVSEAMKAQSQAFVTEDGTAVNKDEKASNQSIAATTQSEDGSTISSFKSTSSSSSSSTMMSSGGGAMPPMGSMGGMSLMGGGA